MKYLPRDVSSFSTMIEGNYVYVDKTKHIYDLFSGGDRFYFLARPRRFGKTLFISTLSELFAGNKRLFKDQWIGKSDYDWTKYPVIHLDFAAIASRSPEILETSLSTYLDEIAALYGLIVNYTVLEDKFRALILELSKKNRVAIIIDEYDLPILNHIKNLELAKKIQDILKSFYGILKGLDKHLRAIFITGVTKFSKTSLFSGLNNLIDLTTEPTGAILLGYTQEEIDNNFKEHVKDFSHTQGISEHEILDIMKNWYNGYRFSSLEFKVYNPFSVLYYLKNQRRQNYWLESGTPTLLIYLLKIQFKSLEEIEHAQLSVTGLGTFEINNIPLVPLLFQTGYLTIDEYDLNSNKFTLTYPNREVSEAFKNYLVEALTYSDASTVETSIARLKDALEKGNVENFCDILQTLFAHIPYHLHIPQEKYYHSLFQFLGVLLDADMQSEVATDKGRIDLIITTRNKIYVIELKFDADPVNALKQIEERKYYERYVNKGKKVILVGIAFNRKKERLNLSYETKTI